MNKEAQDLKRLIHALETKAIIPELTAARKATKKIYEIINGLDLQSELEHLSNIFYGVGYENKPIGKLFIDSNKHLDEVGESFLKLNNQLESEVRSLRKQERGEVIKETPVKEVIEEGMKEDIVEEIMQEDEKKSEPNTKT